MISLFTACPAPENVVGTDEQQPPAEKILSLSQTQAIKTVPLRETLSGSYLSSRFAQRHHDWGQATSFVQDVLTHVPSDLSLKKRSMVLAMGSGRHELAITHAHNVLAEEPYNALALLFTAMEDFKNKEYDEANERINSMPLGSLSSFIMPLLQSWSQAALGVNQTVELRNSALHIYHAILIADYLKQHDTVKALLDQSLDVGDISTNDLTRIATIYAHIGDTKRALDIFQKVLAIEPDNGSALANVKRIKEGDNLRIFDAIESPEDGLAETMFDMARILYADYSDESARIFGYLALFLSPDKIDAKMLLAHIAARNERYDEAISLFQSVPAGDDLYFEARRLAANLLEEEGRIDEALATLNTLVQNQDDIDALIQIGDLHRRAENFPDAIVMYDKAIAKFDGEVPPDYWQLYYVRGMSYEQDDQWEKAEADLKKALEYQPDHPFVLNYLGYSWADQGVRLEESLNMIQRAVSGRPDDGYITDSLGWVYYKLGRYEESVSPLERAVELLPYDPIINDHLGDAYWKVGRRLEARFQWERAKNHSDDPELIKVIDHKLENGLDQPVPIAEEVDAKTIIEDTSLPEPSGQTLIDQ